MSTGPFEGVVKIGSNAVAGVKGFNWSASMAPVDDSDLSDEWAVSVKGRRSWAGQCDLTWEEGDTNGQMAIEAAFLAGTVVVLNLYPEGATAGDIYYTGNAFITSMGVTNTENATVKSAVSFTGSGALARATAV